MAGAKILFSCTLLAAAGGPALLAAETLLLPETVVTASRANEDSLQAMSSIGLVWPIRTHRTVVGWQPDGRPR